MGIGPLLVWRGGWRPLAGLTLLLAGALALAGTGLFLLQNGSQISPAGLAGLALMLWLGGFYFGGYRAALAGWQLAKGAPDGRCLVCGWRISAWWFFWPGRWEKACLGLRKSPVCRRVIQCSWPVGSGNLTGSPRPMAQTGPARTAQLSVQADPGRPSQTDDPANPLLSGQQAKHNWKQLFTVRSAAMIMRFWAKEARERLYCASIASRWSAGFGFGSLLMALGVCWR